MNGCDLATAKERLGIPPTDTTQDTQIQAALDAALLIVENYLDRKLESKERTESFYCQSGHCISLKAYPVTAITSVAPNNDHTLNEASGMLCFGCGGGCSAGNVGDVTVTYTGGYVDLPADLLMALCHVFDNVWGSMQSGGAMAGIDKIVIPDVGSISYAGASADAGVSAGPLGVSIYILNAYRRLSS